MGATKPKRPAKSGANMRAGAGDQASDDGWTSSAASDFVPAKRGKPVKTNTRNKKISNDKVAKAQYDIKSKLPSCHSRIRVHMEEAADIC